MSVYSADISPFGILQPSAFWTPEYLLPPSAWIEHGPFMFWLMDRLRPARFVELGTHYGYSYFCACQAVQSLNLASLCYAVDSWQGDAHSHRYGEEVFTAVRQHNQQYQKFSTLLRCDFDDALNHFTAGSIDLLHIDGLHTYEAVAHDFKAWLPKLSAHALVLFHDTAVHDRDFGVWKFFAELKTQYPHFEFLHGNGLGIIAVGSIPEGVSGLFHASPKITKDICEVFENLGHAVHERRSLLLEHPALQTSMDIYADSIDLHNPPASAPMQKMLQALRDLPDAMRLRLSPLLRWWRKLRYRFSDDAFKIDHIRASVFFDSAWYLKKYTDVATAQLDAATHYYKYGASEGRDPGPLFSTVNYRLNNPVIAETGMNPLLHCEGYGDGAGQSGIAHSDLLTPRDRQAIQRHVARFQTRPLISVLMPVYNPPEKFLDEAIQSVLRQIYPYWELCIANDASSNPTIAPLLDAYAARDSRIKVVHRSQNGNISAASNSALALAQGSFVALLDHDDMLHETALYEVALALEQHPQADVIYSDEDIIDERGRRSSAYHKPDFSPELILGQNMVSHLGVYRRRLLEVIGGFREGYEGSQDYDLFLRAWAASATARIHHIPAVLYHWRKGTAAPSFSESQLEKCTTAARRAIQDYLDQEGEGAVVVPAPALADYSRVIRKVPDPEPLVSVIVPTKDRADLLKVCIDGLLNHTDYHNIEVLIIDHESHESETLQLFKTFSTDARIRILSYRGSFNYSAMNNMAAHQTKGNLLALLNNDIEVIEPGWLKEMVSHAVRQDVGVVGAKLLYPQGTVQHGGVTIGLGGVAGHSFCGLKGHDCGYFAQAVLARSVSAVTAACLVVRKELFMAVGGLNDTHLTVAFNDVDFCLKVQAKGFRNVWTPFATLVHHESVSRGPDSAPDKKVRVEREIAYMKDTWGQRIANDPFYNPNLSLNSSASEPARPTRRQKPWVAYL